MPLTQTRYHLPVSNSSFSILSKQPPLDHESFAAHRELEAILKKNLRGEVRFDLGSRALYATDSSNYRQLPVGVVFPRDAGDVEAALAACWAEGAAAVSYTHLDVYKRQVAYSAREPRSKRTSPRRFFFRIASSSRCAAKLS